MKLNVLCGVWVLAATCLAGATAHAQAEWFAADLQGLALTPTFPDIRLQVGPAAYDSTHGAVVEGWADRATPPGTLLTYVATPGLPQMPAAAINWSLYAVAVAAEFDGVMPVSTDFAGTFRFFAAGGSPDDGRLLEHGTFTARALYYDIDADMRIDYADVEGLLVADAGALVSPDWPVPVDWAAGTPALFTGRIIHVDGPETFTGRVASVPEPGAAHAAVAAVCAALAVARRRLVRRGRAI